MKHKPVSSVAVLLLLTACSESSIQLHIQQHRSVLPEAVGAKEFSVQAGVHSREYTVSLSDNPLSQPVNTTNPIVTTGSHNSSDVFEDMLGPLTLGLGYGLTDNLELAYQGFFRFKYMLIGEPQTRAKAGNWSLAITYGHGTSKDSGNDSAPFHSIDYEYKIHSDNTDLALISGYRTHDRVLFYGGIFTSRYDYGVDITNADTAESSHFSGDAKVNGINIGLHVGLSTETAIELEHVFSKLEAGESHLNGRFTGINMRTRF